MYLICTTNTTLIISQDTQVQTVLQIPTGLVPKQFRRTVLFTQKQDIRF